jgi:membrane protease YdiL (CAAX protease family)
VLSPRPWKLEAVLRLALGVFACFFVGLLLVALLEGGVRDKSPVTIRQIIVSALLFQGAIVVFVWRFVREHEMSWASAFGLRNAKIYAVALGVLASCLFLPVGGMLQRISLVTLEQMGIETTVQSAVEALHHAGQGPGLLAFVLITVVVAPLGEELLFRGVLYPAIKHAGFPQAAWWGTSLLFAAIHFNLPTFVPLLLLSLLLIWLYERTDNLLAPLTAHACFNAANLVIFFLNGDSPAKLPAPQ